MAEVIPLAKTYVQNLLVNLKMSGADKFSQIQNVTKSIQNNLKLDSKSLLPFNTSVGEIVKKSHELGNSLRQLSINGDIEGFKANEKNADDLIKKILEVKKTITAELDKPIYSEKNKKETSNNLRAITAQINRTKKSLDSLKNDTSTNSRRRDVFSAKEFVNENYSKKALDFNSKSKNSGLTGQLTRYIKLQEIAIENNKRTTAEDRKRLSLAKKNKAEAEKHLAKLTKHIGASRKIKEMEEEILSLEKRHNEVSSKSKILKEKSTKLTEEERDELKRTKSELKKIESELSKVVKQNTKVKEETAKAKDEQRAQGTAIKHSSNLIKELVIKQITYNQVLRIAKRAWRSIITTVSELDKSLTDIAVVTGKSRNEVYGLLGAYQDLSKQVGLATTDVVKLSTQFFRQGKTVEETFALTETAAKLAKIAMIDVTDAADYLTSTLNGFNLSANQAVSVTDKLAKLSATSASSVEELAKALQKVAPSAKTAGVSLDNMLGFMAKGIETTREAPENIGTAFKTIFARMAELKDLGKTTEDGMDLSRVDKALKDVGVTLVDTVNGGFRPLDDVLIDLGNRWGELDSFQKSYVGTALAGTRQQSRLHAVMNDFPRTLELIKESQNSAGTAALQHQAYMEGLEAAMTNLQTTWQTFITSISNSETIIGIVKAITGGLELFVNILNSWVGKIVILTGILTGAKVGFSAFSGYIVKLEKLLKGNKDALSASQKAILNFYNSMRVGQKGINKNFFKDMLNGVVEKYKAIVIKIKEIGIASTRRNEILLTENLITKKNLEQQLLSVKIAEIKKVIDKEEIQAKRDILILEQKELENRNSVLLNELKILKAKETQLKSSKHLLTNSARQKIFLGATLLLIVGILAFYKKINNAIPTTKNFAEWQAALDNIKEAIKTIWEGIKHLSDIVEKLLNGITSLGEGFLALAGVATIALAIMSGGTSIMIAGILAGVAAIMLAMAKLRLTTEDRAEAAIVATTNQLKDLNQEVKNLKNEIEDLESKWKRLGKLESLTFLSSSEKAELEELKRYFDKWQKENPKENIQSFIDNKNQQLVEMEEKRVKIMKVLQDDEDIQRAKGYELDNELQKKAKGSKDYTYGEFRSVIDEANIQKEIEQNKIGALSDNIEERIAKAIIERRNVEEIKFGQNVSKVNSSAYDRYGMNQFDNDSAYQVFKAEQEKIEAGITEKAREFQGLLDELNAGEGVTAIDIMKRLGEYTSEEIEALSKLYPEFRTLTKVKENFNNVVDNLGENGYKTYARALQAIQDVDMSSQDKDLFNQVMKDIVTNPNFEGIENDNARFAELMTQLQNSGVQIDSGAFGEIMSNLFSTMPEYKMDSVVENIDGLTNKYSKMVAIINSKQIDGKAFTSMLELLDGDTEAMENWLNGTLDAYEIVFGQTKEIITELEANLKGLIATTNNTEKLTQAKNELLKAELGLLELQKEQKDLRINDFYDNLNESIKNQIKAIDDLKQSMDFIEKIQAQAEQTTIATRIGLDTTIDGRVASQQLQKDLEKVNKEIEMEARKMQLEAQITAADKARDEALINSQTNLTTSIVDLNKRIEESFPGEDVSYSQDPTTPSIAKYIDNFARNAFETPQTNWVRVGGDQK